MGRTGHLSCSRILISWFCSLSSCYCILSRSCKLLLIYSLLFCRLPNGLCSQTMFWSSFFWTCISGIFCCRMMDWIWSLFRRAWISLFWFKESFQAFQCFRLCCLRILLYQQRMSFWFCCLIRPWLFYSFSIQLASLQSLFRTITGFWYLIDPPSIPFSCEKRSFAREGYID